MAKIISRDFLNKKLTGVKLDAKVGAVKIEGKKLRGIGIKKFALAKLAGKTPGEIKRLLREKYHVSGYQQEKREKFMEMIEGGEKSGLSKEQIKTNLEVRKQRDTSALGFTSAGRLARPAGEKGTKERIGIKSGTIGFAQNFSGKKPSVIEPPKATPSGVRPIGL